MLAFLAALVIAAAPAGYDRAHDVGFTLSGRVLTLKVGARSAARFGGRRVLVLCGTGAADNPRIAHARLRWPGQASERRLRLHGSLSTLVESCWASAAGGEQVAAAMMR